MMLPLRIYNLQTVAIAVAVAFLVGGAISGVGTWRVIRWMDANATLKVERAATQTYVDETDRQRDIGVRHAERQGALTRTFEAQDDDLATLVESNPDWRDIDIGDDGLCRWNAWNEGKTAALAGCRTVGALPGLIAEGEERTAAGSAGEPQAERAAVPPLQDERRPAD